MLSSIYFNCIFMKTIFQNPCSSAFTSKIRVPVIFIILRALTSSEVLSLRIRTSNRVQTAEQNTEENLLT